MRLRFRWPFYWVKPKPTEEGLLKEPMVWLGDDGEVFAVVTHFNYSKLPEERVL